MTARTTTAISAELEAKIPPVVRGGGGYILHSDHSEPPEVDHDTMHYFIDRGRDIALRALRNCEV